MRRYLFPILFVVVLVTPFVLRLAIGTSHGPVATGNLRLIVITPHGEPIRREFADAFSAWHQKKFGQSVTVDYRNFGGGASDILKYFDSSQPLFASKQTYGVDIIWGGGDDLFAKQLKRYLDPVELSPEVMKASFPTADIGGVLLYDKEHAWYGTALASFGIVYNKDLVRHLGVPEPKTWSDLADPRYRGWIILADPTRSASVRKTFMTIVERAMADAELGGKSQDEGWARGMGLIRQIASNARVFTDASSSVPGSVGDGDAAVGMAIDFYGRTQIEASGESRVGYVEPLNATVVNPDPIAIVKGAEHKQLATRFIEFVVSAEGQKLWNYKVGAPGGPKQTALRRLPIMRSLYSDLTHFSDKVNPFEVAGTFNTRPERCVTYASLGEQIQVSCIDVLGELRETRREVINSPRAAELDAKLGVFPYGEKEAIRRQNELAGPKGNPTPPLRKLELIREWEQQFKAEYKKLREEAE